MYMKNEIIRTKVLFLVITSCRLAGGGGSCVLVRDDEIHGEQSLTIIVTECFQMF